MTGTILLVLAAAAQAAGTYVVDAPKSAIRFHVDHALHAVDGRAPGVEAKAVLAPDGELKAMARAQVAALETGDGNRDANMRATLDADRFPHIVLKGTSKVAMPAQLPATVQVKLAGELDLHGVKRQMEIPLTVSFAGDGTARIQGRFDVSLEAHRIERPSLLFKKVADACKVEVDLALRQEGR